MEKEGKIMSEEKRLNEKELNDEELDKVSGGGFINELSKQEWQKELQNSRSPESYGATYEEWLELQKVRIESHVYGRLRCPDCGSWRTVPLAGPYHGCAECKDCGKPLQIVDCINTWGDKGVSIDFK